MLLECTLKKIYILFGVIRELVKQRNRFVGLNAANATRNLQHCDFVASDGEEIYTWCQVQTTPLHARTSESFEPKLHCTAHG